ncbi:MAG: PfkB family carbohydrate kinase [Spirochaetaceae bacterium]
MSDRDVVVVGGINADVTGRSAEELVPGTSNPGTISITPGGAGRNIAEALARLGLSSRLVGTVGDDEFGRAVLARTVEAGVGDAFTAGFCAGIGRGDGIEAAIRMGAATAALTVESVGTVPVDLTLDAVRQVQAGRGS